MASKAVEILARVKDLAGISSSITTEDNNILRRISDVQWWLYHVNPNWRGLQAYQDLTLADGVEYVTVPSDVAGVFSIRSLEASGNKLIYISPSKYNALIPDGAALAEGEPIFYTWWGGRFWFHPIPDDDYVFKLWYYQKPTNLKIYSTGTAAYATLIVTGTTTAFSTNANVDNTMFFAFQSDVRSDGTYPWTTITTVTDADHMTVAAYTGNGSTAATYWTSSALVFPEEFDQLIIMKATMLTAGRNRDNKEFLETLANDVSVLFESVRRSQSYVPDHSPMLEDFTPSGLVPFGETWKQPFVRSN